jgi:hypothetical protein
MRLRIAALLLVIGVLATGVYAQNIISARAGYVNYSHGRVVLPSDTDGKPVKQLRDGESASTGSGGRAELLLTPGSYLRLDSDSGVRMLSTKLTEPAVELLRGTASLEVNELPKSATAALTVVWHEKRIPVTRAGMYRFEPNPDFMRVYVLTGKLRLPGDTHDLKAGRYEDISATGELSASAKFNARDLDDFDRFNRRRSAELTVASYQAARSYGLGRSGFLGMPWGMSWGMWTFNPWMGFYTWLPYSYSVCSPWGYYYYAPWAFPPTVVISGGTPVTPATPVASVPVPAPAPPATPPPNRPGRSESGGIRTLPIIPTAAQRATAPSAGRQASSPGVSAPSFERSAPAPRVSAPSFERSAPPSFDRSAPPSIERSAPSAQPSAPAQRSSPPPAESSAPPSRGTPPPVIK